MKKILIATLAALLALSIVLAASADGWKELNETAVSKPAAGMTAEELYETGKAAKDAGDYAKALEYCQLAADLGSSEAIKEIGNLYFFGLGVETDYDKAFEMVREEASGIIKRAPGLIRGYTSYLTEAQGKMMRAAATLACSMKEEEQVMILMVNMDVVAMEDVVMI